MVYRGKPSLGCKKCRQRKIKCDERPGGCAKCEDKGHPCPGYDNPLDRFFHDESAVVQVKAEKAKAKAIIAREEREKNARAKVRPTVLNHNVGFPLLGPLVDQGITYFMSNYAIGLEKPPMQSQMYNKHVETFGFHPLIATSMTALGLAGIANLWMDPGLKREAMKWYSNALKMTNKALMSPAEVKSDNTLFATLLLSVFESTSNELSLMGWANHVSGSASLLHMRGKEQFSTPAGRRMYLQTVGMLAIRCMGSGEPLPAFVHEFNSEVAKWEDKRDPGNRFYHLHIAAADFRAQVLNGGLATLDAIIDRAVEIDTWAQNIFVNGDGDWQYTVEHCAEGTPGVFGTYYHVYPSLAAAQTWCWVYYNRIFLLDVLRNSLMTGLSSTPPLLVGTRYLYLLEHTTQSLYKMQADIMASMPQYLHDTPKVPTPQYANDFEPSTAQQDPETPDIGYASSQATPEAQSPPQPLNPLASSIAPTPAAALTSTSTPLPTPQNPPKPKKLFTSNFLPNPLPKLHHSWPPDYPATPHDQLPIIRVSGGYSSLFALYIAGATAIASPESQAYIGHTLERIGIEFGINQARVLAKVLQVKIALDRAGWRGAMMKGKGAWSVVPDYMPDGPHVETTPATAEATDLTSCDDCYRRGTDGATSDSRIQEEADEQG